jgi:hypothetical protein
MLKKIIKIALIFISTYIYVNSIILFAAEAQPGGEWHFMWYDQWKQYNYQCQPVQQNPSCWPAWAWQTSLTPLAQ